MSKPYCPHCGLEDNLVFIPIMLDPSRVTIHMAGPTDNSREWWQQWIKHARDETGKLIPASDKLTIAYCSRCNTAQLEKAEWAPEPEPEQDQQ